MFQRINTKFSDSQLIIITTDVVPHPANRRAEISPLN